MSQVFEAPQKVITNSPTLFLAGTIDNGNSINWQKEVVQNLADFDISFLNPRRKDWDSSWKQTKENVAFKEQVDWELDYLENADFILMNFVKDSQSPISLLELGLFAENKNLVVVCSSGFWRRGNVEIVCERYNVPFYENIDQALAEIKRRLELKVVNNE